LLRAWGLSDRDERKCWIDLQKKEKEGASYSYIFNLVPKKILIDLVAYYPERNIAQ
jgi:hypothetical protein